MTHTLHFQPLRRNHADCFAFPSVKGTPLPSPVTDAHPPKATAARLGWRTRKITCGRAGRKQQKAACRQRPHSDPRASLGAPPLPAATKDRAGPDQARPDPTKRARAPRGASTRGPRRIARSRRGCPHLLPASDDASAGYRGAGPGRHRLFSPLPPPPQAPRPASPPRP